MGRRKRGQDDDDNGFAQWGGYMAAKRAKLLEQFTATNLEKLSDIFQGVAILVNGYTKPNSEELKALMAQHGGLYHAYQESATTHIIASNLPNVKITKLGNVPIVKPGWIVDSIALGRRLDYGNYLLYNNQSRTQPKLNFYLDIKTVKNDKSTNLDNKIDKSPNKNDKSPNLDTKNDIELDIDDLFIDKNDVNIDWSTKKIDTVKLDSSIDFLNRVVSVKNEVFSAKSPVRNINFDNFPVKNDTSIESIKNNNNDSTSDCDIFDSDIEIDTNKSQNKMASVKSDKSVLNSDKKEMSTVRSDTTAKLSLNSDNINNNLLLDCDIFDMELESNDIFKNDTDKIDSVKNINTLNFSKNNKNFLNCNNVVDYDNDTVKSSTNIVTKESSLVKSNNCVVKNDSSVVKNDSSVVKNDINVINSNNSLVKSDNSLVKSDNSFVKSDNSLVKNDINVVKTDTLSKKPQTKTASDPKFLSEFYNNSRLHLIATLGAEFKQLVNDLREKSTNHFPALADLKPRAPQPPPTTPIIMHIDMDCFFVSVGLRTRPELKGRPVAVTHSKGGGARGGVDRKREIEMYMERLPQGAESRLEDIDNSCSLSEIASCSYEARGRGVKNGMFMGAALKLCPDLKAIPYDFQGYREVSSTLYETISKYTLDIEAVSCDEMYVDVTEILRKTHLGVDEWAEHIRGVIRSKTGCPCSTGFGANRLQARLATKTAKPDGKYYLKPHEVQGYFSGLSLGELPGVGRATLAKLKVLGFETCGDIQGGSLGMIQKELGGKIGETIWEQCRGVDRKPLSFEHERKSVSAEVNYGIRFKSEAEAVQFLESLAVEVQGRLVEAKMRAKCVTLKLMVRAQDAPTETAKFLGHGVCDSLSRSSSLPSATEDPKIIFKEAKNLYDKLKVPFEDLRGLGIQLSRLEKSAAMNNLMKSFLNQPKKQANAEVEDKTVATTSKLEGCKLNLPTTSASSSGLGGSREEVEGCKGKGGGRGRPKGTKVCPKVTNNDLSNYFRATQKDRKVQTKGNKPSNKPDIDLEVLSELPEEIRKEIIKEYNLNPQKPPKLKNDSKPAVAPTPATSTKKSPKNGFSALNFATIKTIISNWVQHEPRPLNIDVIMLADHFRQLALDRKIENLNVAIKFLHRQVFAKDCDWHEAYFTVLNSLQQGMVMRYGNALFAPRKFDCQKHGILNK